METDPYTYLNVWSQAEGWRPPTVTFKPLLHLDVAALAINRPTPTPSTPLYIQDAINILVDLRRLPDPRADIDDALSEARDVAMEYIGHWLTTPELAVQVEEVHTTNAIARFYWRARLSCMAASEMFSVYRADDVIIAVRLHSGEWLMYLWHQVAELVQLLVDEDIPPTPPATPTVGGERLEEQE
jgi:hypothetical protein